MLQILRHNKNVKQEEIMDFFKFLEKVPDFKLFDYRHYS